jgi:hypothetical protein
MDQSGSVKEHYDKHLGSLYSWMIGDFQTLVQRQKEEFTKAGIAEGGSAIALDLGAGTGVQTVALCDMGYKVTAIDFNKQLLEELRANTVEHEVHIIKDDLLVGYKLDISPSLVVCCGDTIAHLPDYIKLEELIAGSYSSLAEGGKLYLTFRDYSRALEGTDRFIPIRQDDTRIFMCFLEYFDDRVRVTDILLEKAGDRWEQKISHYFKLRITVAMIENILQRYGFEIVYKQLSGMNVLVGQKGKANDA